MFTHKFINHDDVGGLYSDCAFGLSSGRWLLHFVTGWNGNFSSSWLNGLAGAFYLAIAVWLVVRLFRVKHRLPALLIALTMISFPTVASTYSYMFCSAQYLFSLAFSVIGACCIYKGSVKWMAAGVVAIALSMGCYQAYFCLAFVLLVVALGLDLCENRLKKFLLTALKYVACLALGMALYMLILKLCLWYTGTELVSYQGISSMGQLTFATLIKRICMAYYKFFVFYGNTNIFNRFFPILVVLCCLSIGCMILVAVFRKKLYQQGIMMAFLAVLVLLLPLAANSVFLMAEAETIHLVMRYSMVVPLILSAIAADRLAFRNRSGAITKMRKKVVVFATVFLLALQFACGYEFVLVTNRAYFSMDMTYENTYAYFVKLTAKVELQEGYTTDSRIAFIGTASMDSHVPQTYLTGVLVGDEALNIYTRSDFLSYFLGTDYRLVGDETCEALRSTEEFQQMPCYPAEGSIQTIDGIIVVKFS